MEKKESNLGLLMLFILIVILIIGGIGLIFVFYQPEREMDTSLKTNESSQIVNDNKKEVIKENNNTILESNTVSSEKNEVENFSLQVTEIDKTHATIEAINNENSIKKDIEATVKIGPDGFNSYSTQMEIDNTDISTITGYGNVVLITEKLEDEIVIRVFGLVDNEIKEFGRIDTFSSLLVKDVDYKTEKTEDGFSIEATKSDGTTKSHTAVLSNEEKVINIETVSWADDVQFVLVSEELFGKKEVNVFGLTEIESINRVGIEKLATLEDIPIN